jgi:hypothetical protein
MTTPEQVHAMSDDELRVKIAEALGWKWIPVTPPNSWLVFEDKFGAFRNEITGNIVICTELPKWTADLNAAAELTELVRKSGRTVTIKLFSEETGGDVICVSGSCDSDEIYIFAATEPRARAEAWLLWWMEAHK